MSSYVVKMEMMGPLLLLHGTGQPLGLLGTVHLAANLKMRRFEFPAMSQRLGHGGNFKKSFINTQSVLATVYLSEGVLQRLA